MSQKFTQAFKIQAVEKALIRTEGVSVSEIAESLGVGYSTLPPYVSNAANSAARNPKLFPYRVYSLYIKNL